MIQMPIGMYTYMKKYSEYSNVVVITQPMYFPWIGFLSQLSMADTIIWLDDVQYSKGSFTNRVQLKTGENVSWLTCNLRDKGKNYLIKDLELSSIDVIDHHYQRLKRAYFSSSYFEEIQNVFRKTWAGDNSLCETLIKSSQNLCNQIGFCLPRQYRSSEMHVLGKGSRRVLDLVKSVGGDLYLTGHGAKNYLHHKEFNKFGVDVHYMIYDGFHWMQSGQNFTPYVTGLDLIANVGPNVRQKCLKKASLDWRSLCLN